MKLISSIPDEFLQNSQNIFQAASALDFTIPVEIFTSLDLLTNDIGYFLPLRLYSPIITLILGYWFILISAAGYRCITGFLSNIFTIFTGK